MILPNVREQFFDSEIMSASSSPVNAIEIESQLGEAYHRFDAGERACHVELLQSIKRPKDVALHAEPRNDNRWTVTISTSDCIGALSAIAGLFAVHGINIRTVDVFTLNFGEHSNESAGNFVQPQRRYFRRPHRRIRPREPSQPAKRILDIFEVQAPKELDSTFWQRFQDDLKELIALLVDGHQNGAQEKIIERFSVAINPIDDENQLFAVFIDIDNEDSPDYTKLTISSADTLGFLFAYTNALTTLGVNIEKATIQTVDGEVCDTFWLTESSGSKIVSEKRLPDLRIATALIKQFTYLLPRSTNPSQAMRQFNAMTRQILSNPAWTEELHDLESPRVLELLADLMGVSQFLWEDFLRMQHENLFPVLLDVPSLNERKSSESLRESFHAQSQQCEDNAQRINELNRFKDREMFRIDLRHITRRIDFQDFEDELSDLAEVVVAEAASLANEELEKRYGIPTLEDGSPCPWSICALGKFGGRELGYGSDIELVFVYEGEGITNGAASIENSRYFGDLVRTFLTTVKAQREGIFEIDLRLRPHGNKGPMASSFEEFGRYYSQDGPAQQFERLALVKLRPVAGDTDLGTRILKSRDRFVYSTTPIDIENVTHLRRRQTEELVTPGVVNAKYSPGGLVDVEYFVQVCQILAGQSDVKLRVTNTLDAIDQLTRTGFLENGKGQKLRETYGFLRRLIDGLRVVRGHAKDLTIPASDTRGFAYLTQRLQFDSTAKLEEEIASRMAFARSIWDDTALDIP